MTEWQNGRIRFVAEFASLQIEQGSGMIDVLGVPEMSRAISAYHSITASPEFQELERLRIKASHDEAQAVYNAGR